MPGNLNSNTVQSELYFLIAHFLNNSPFSQSAQGLIEQLEQHQVFPRRVDWNGREHARTFQDLSQHYNHIPPNFLLQICNQLRSVLEQQFQIRFNNVNTLLGTGQYSVLQDTQQLIEKKNQIKTSNPEALPRDLYINYHSSNSNYHNFSKYSTNGGANLILNLHKRALDGRLKLSSIVQPELFKSVSMHKRILGHLSAVYCVCFDRTGRYILTGADDNLIKAWNAYDGRLLATFRGHEKEISDIDISFENTILASGSCDKSIRIWNLKTTEALSILNAHTSMVTSIEFSPSCNGTSRWLASSGNDGVICFWQWNSKTLAFNPKPKKFIEKSRPGGQMLCLSFSAGGSFLAAGSNDHAIRVYFFDQDNPIKICELESHTNLVDSIQYANNSARFLSGSKDGTARIWKYESQKWKAILIDASKTLNKPDNDELSMQDIHKKYSVTMVTWNCDDSLVVTAQNNFLIKVWNSNDAQLVHELKGHNDEIFVLEAHPKDPRLILSAGHDGNVIIWNILTGKLIKKFYNRIENEGHGCLFDTKWSPNQDMFAATDSHGYLTLFGFGSDDKFKRIPNEQFFHTDYRPLMRDQTGYAVDEQTQQAPHLMPPPFLVNADGNPYNVDYQRLVPGRENLTDAQLSPHVITNDNGVAEIIGDRDPEEIDDRTNGEGTNQPQARQRHLWIKDLIRPLDSVILGNSESSRTAKFNDEQDYFISEYRKELKKSNDAGSSSEMFDTNSNNATTSSATGNNNAKRRRGKPPKDSSRNESIRNINEDSLGTAAVKNRLTTKALFDTDNEDNDMSPGTSASRLRSTASNVIFDDETNDQFIDIDNNSNTQHSNPTTSNRAGTTSRYSNILDSSEIADSSEYSDWEAGDGRTHRNLSKQTKKKNSKKNIQIQKRRVITESDNSVSMDEDDANVSDNPADEEMPDEDESFVVNKKSKSKTLSKKLKRVISDDDDDDEEEVYSKSRRTARKNSEDEEEIYNSDHDDDDDYDETYSDHSELDEMNLGKSYVDDENDENLDPNKPCTSKQADQLEIKSPRKRGRKPKNLTDTPSSASKKPISYKNSKLSQDSSILADNNHKPAKIKLAAIKNECPIEHRPPEWLTSTKPKKSPYVAQIGDEVVYFRQGHQLYIDAVKNNKYYTVDEKSLPWSTGDIGVQEFCKVIGMKIENIPPRLVCLELVVLNHRTGQPTDVKFSIKYHDIDNVVDFVILKQFYDRAIARNWQVDDRFRCIIDDAWYIGTITSKQPYQAEFPDCQFQSLKIVWDTSEEDTMSPWDIETLTDDPNPNRVKIQAEKASTPVNPDELRSLLYIPNEIEWRGEGRDAECERILAGLEKIMELSIAEPFNYPVDLDAFPQYAVFIPYPIDLNTIKERLENRYYRRINSIEWDIKIIETNAHSFNEPKSEIVRKASLLTELLIEFINDPHCTNPMPIYKRKNKNFKLDTSIRSTTSANGQDDNYDSEHDDEKSNKKRNNLKLRSRAHFNLKMKNSKTGRKVTLASELPTNKRGVSEYSWKEQCQKLLDDIMKHLDSRPFREPVDTVEYRDYLEVISTPIDFGTIRRNLISNKYGDNLNKFDSDCRLLFRNSKTYNTNKRSPIYGMTLRLQALYDSRIAEIITANNEHKASLEKTSKYGRHRKARYPDMDFFNDTISTNVNVKSTKHKLQNLDNYDNENSTGGGYLTRSSSNRKIKSINENSNSQTEHPKPSVSGASSSSALFHRQDQKTLYYEDEESVREEPQDINTIFNEDSAFNLNKKSSAPAASTSVASNVSKKNRITRADSETVLSYNDAIENESTGVVVKIENIEHDQNSKKTAKKQSKARGNKRGPKKGKKKNLDTTNEETDDDDSKDKDYQSQNDTENDANEDFDDYNKETNNDDLNDEIDRKKDKKIKTEEGYETDMYDDEDDDNYEEDDDDDEDYNYKKGVNSGNKRTKKVNSNDKLNNKKNTRQIQASTSNGRSSRLKSNKNLDNKENDDEFQHSNQNGSHKINGQTSSKIKDSKEKTRSSKRARKQFSYKESSNDEASENEDDYEKYTEENRCQDDDPNDERTKTRTRNSKRRKYSPVEPDDENSNQAFAHDSNSNSSCGYENNINRSSSRSSSTSNHAATSSTVNHSYSSTSLAKISSRGRLLKTVSQIK